MTMALKDKSFTFLLFGHPVMMHDADADCWGENPTCICIHIILEGENISESKHIYVSFKYVILILSIVSVMFIS